MDLDEETLEMLGHGNGTVSWNVSRHTTTDEDWRAEANAGRRKYPPGEAHRMAVKKWRKKNAEKVAAAQRARYATDEAYRIKQRAASIASYHRRKAA